MNWLTITGDFYGFTGAFIQVFARTWLSHRLEHPKDLVLPAGADRINWTRSGYHFDILSFSVIGIGFILLMLGNLGVKSSWIETIVPSLFFVSGVVGLAFSSYETEMSETKSRRGWRLLYGSSMPVLVSTLVGSIGTFFSAIFVALYAHSQDWVVLAVFIVAGLLLLVYFAIEISFREFRHPVK